MAMRTLIFIFILICSAPTFAQIGNNGQLTNRKIDGEIVTIYVTPEGDSLVLAELEEVTVSTPRDFKNREEYQKYRRYKRYALKVYPYAVKAIRIFRELEVATAEMNRRKRKKYVRKLQKEYQTEFKDQLKRLSKTQGKILVKMIEKELETDFYSLIKELKGRASATFWNASSKIYGYNLKEGYIPGQDPIMDGVISDLNISYDIN